MRVPEAGGVGDGIALPHTRILGVVAVLKAAEFIHAEDGVAAADKAVQPLPLHDLLKIFLGIRPPRFPKPAPIKGVKFVRVLPNGGQAPAAQLPQGLVRIPHVRDRIFRVLVPQDVRTVVHHQGLPAPLPQIVHGPLQGPGLQSGPIVGKITVDVIADNAKAFHTALLQISSCAGSHGSSSATAFSWISGLIRSPWKSLPPV